MSPADLVGFAFGALRGHRLRTVLSIAGVAVGIAAVVALTALGEGARQYVVQEFMSLGTNLLIVIPGKSDTAGGMPMPFGGTTHDLTLDDFRAVMTRVPQIMRAARSLAISMKKFMPAAQKKEMRGQKASTSSPAFTPVRTYSRPSASV